MFVSPSNQYANYGVTDVGYTNERDEMNDLSDYIIERLEQYGVTVYRNNSSGNINSWLRDSNYLGVDLHIASQYNSFVQNPEIRDTIWNKILEEYQRTMRALIVIRGENKLLDSEPTLQKSILLRNNSVMTLNLLQIELIKKYHAAGYEAKRTRLVELIHSTIVGIAQGLRNTG